MANASKQSTLAKLAGTAAAVIAAALAQRVVTAAWQATKGHKPPAAVDPDEDINFGEVLAAAAITAALVALARVAATRGTVKFAARVNAARSTSD